MKNKREEEEGEQKDDKTRLKERLIADKGK